MGAIFYTKEIIKEIDAVINDINDNKLLDLEKLILSSKKIYVSGAGRSGLMIRSLGMRLMHLGLNAYVIGEISTPALEKGDLIIFGSNSGETGSLRLMAESAKNLGANIALITSNPESTIGKLADCIVDVPISAIEESVQPSGSTFEISMFLLCEGLFLELFNKVNKNNEINVNDFIRIRHANIE